MDWNSTFKDRFSELIGDTPYRLIAEKISVSKATVSAYATGTREPKKPVLLSIANAYNVNPLWLSGADVPKFLSKDLKDFGRSTYVLEEWQADFTLISYDDSMEPGIHSGDVVAVRKQSTVENGQIAAVKVDDAVILRAVYFHEDFIELRPINLAFESIIRPISQMDQISIEGLVVGYLHLMV